MGKHTWYIGIDEVGRGSLAGPVMVGVFAVHADYLHVLRTAPQHIQVRDSKQMTVAARQRAADYLHELAMSGIARYAIAMQDVSYINEYGIAPAIRVCISEGLGALITNSLGPRLRGDDDDLLTPFNSRVYLDGGLCAPLQWLHQSTHVHGDDSYPVISAASILAKVTRDQYMHDLAGRLPEYGWDRNAGYGTADHRSAVMNHGMTQHHRTLFCRRILGIR